MKLNYFVLKFQDRYLWKIFVKLKRKNMIKQDKTGYQFNQECINDVSKGFLEAQSYLIHCIFL